MSVLVTNTEITIHRDGTPIHRCRANLQQVNATATTPAGRVPQDHTTTATLYLPPGTPAEPGDRATDHTGQRWTIRGTGTPFVQLAHTETTICQVTPDRDWEPS